MHRNKAPLKVRSDNPQASRGSSLSHSSQIPWQFDAEVTEVFEDMLIRSIPQYQIMRQLVFDIGRAFVQPNTHIIDLGCSKGEALAPFVSTFGEENRYLGVEASKPMLQAARERFAAHEFVSLVEIRELDLCVSYPNTPASLTLCILTLQFLPPESRMKVLQYAFNETLPGGAMILVEKIRGASDALDQLMVERYHLFKQTQGYSKDAIELKRQGLEGVLVPLTARENEHLLHDAGFTQVDTFWRWLNFAGWIAVKG
jgi:tRNA (cmo5U34)-methyltransferase